MWVKQVCYQNIGLLREACLPLERFTLLIGPNNSGKSTALRALLWAPGPAPFPRSWVTAGTGENVLPSVKVEGAGPLEGEWWRVEWGGQGRDQLNQPSIRGSVRGEELRRKLFAFKVFEFKPELIASPGRLTPQASLQPSGQGLVVVLDRLRDEAPERFEALNEELSRWLPEFDRVLFETPGDGMRGLVLRTRGGMHRIPASQLSSGTLLALALLTLLYLPDPPAILALEEPDRNLHPRLLPLLRDALYRLAYPDPHGGAREPVQVIATTHSPLFLDLFRDHPEEVVIAERTPEGVVFRRLSEHPGIQDILPHVSLGEAWYSGVLGGVPPLP